MKKILALLSLTLLVSCGEQQEPLKQTRDDSSFTVVLSIVPANQIEKTCKDLGVEYQANGCNSFDVDKKICTIYVMPARYVNDTDRLSVIGHELWHCRYGKFHD